MSATSLDSFPDNLSPAAPRTGPFPHAPFIAAAHRAVSPPGAELLVEVSDEGAVALSVHEGKVTFAADQSITDYHATLGPGGADALAKALGPFGRYRFEFDSLPVEALAVVESALGIIGAAYKSDIHAATGVLELPASFDEWLFSIGKKERHEVRRKRRKLVAEFGEFEVVSVGAAGIGSFCDMHRTAAGAKGGFMTEDMEEYFGDLLDNVDAVIHNLVCDGYPLASAFGFVRPEGYYFYNSAFASDASHVSPGSVLLSALIERQIDRGAAIFDFLKGAETYKYKQGAVARDLYSVKGSIP